MNSGLRISQSFWTKCRGECVPLAAFVDVEWLELETDMETDKKYSHVLRDTSPMISPMMGKVSLET